MHQMWLDKHDQVREALSDNDSAILAFNQLWDLLEYTVAVRDVYSEELLEAWKENQKLKEKLEGMTTDEEVDTIL